VGWILVLGGVKAYFVRILRVIFGEVINRKSHLIELNERSNFS